HVAATTRKDLRAPPDLRRPRYIGILSPPRDAPAAPWRSAARQSPLDRVRQRSRGRLPRIPPSVVADDARLGTVANETEAALLEHPDRRDQLGQRLGDDPVHLRVREGVANEPGGGLCCEPLPLVLRQDRVADLDQTLL